MKHHQESTLTMVDHLHPEEKGYLIASKYLTVGVSEDVNDWLILCCKGTRRIKQVMQS